MEAKLKKILSDILGVQQESIDDNFTKDSTPEWDSVNQLAIITSIEEEFDIRLTDEQTLQMLSYKLIKIILQEHGIQ